MAATMQIELNAADTRELLHLAHILRMSPEETSQRAIEDGLHMLRRQAFYVQNAGSVTAEEGLAILDRAGRNNPPDPQDELPKT